MKNTYRYALLGAGLLTITSCGGGGSSSGGGDSSPHAGRYNGTINSSFTVDGETYRDSDRLQIQINSNGTGAFIDSSNESFPATISGNRISHSSQFREAEDGVVCTGTQNLNGTINGNKITGTFSGSGRCSGYGATLPFTLGGNFNATKVTGASKALNTTGNSGGLIGRMALPR